MATIRKFTLKSGVRYEAQIRKDGYPERSKRFRLKSEAEAWARQIESEMDRGVFQDRSEAESTSLRECIERYEREVTVHKKSAAKERSLLRLWNDEYADDKPGLALRSMASLKSSEFAALSHLWLKTLEPATVVRRLALVSNIFSKAIKDWGMTTLTNAPKGITKPSIRNARNRRVTSIENEDMASRGIADDEVSRIIGATESKFLGPLIHLALETAARRGELVRLKWSDVDLVKRYVIFADTKNGEDRHVPLSQVAFDVIQKLPKSVASGSVFYMTEDAVTRAFSRARDRARAAYEKECCDAGVKPAPTFLIDISFHDLRHEATSRLALKGMPMHILAAITGHKDTRMLLRYYNPTVGELAKWFN